MKATHQIRRKWADGCESITTGYLAFDITGAEDKLLIRCRNGVTGWRRFFHSRPVLEDDEGTMLAEIELPRFAGNAFTLRLPDGQREKIGVDTPLPSGLSPELGIAVECFRSLWFKTDAGDNDCGD